MIQQQIKYCANKLQQKSYKPFYLAFLRVAVSCWLLKEICINWGSMDILYGPATFAVPKNNVLSKIGSDSFFYFRQHYIWFIAAYIVVLLLNIFGIGKWFMALVLFLMVYFLQQMNLAFLNSGDKMLKFILLYLIFADTYQYFVLVKKRSAGYDTDNLQNLLSNLAALSIMLQLCVAYFASALAKLHDTMWLHGEATYYVLLMERFMGTTFNKYIAQHKWIDIITDYTALLFELLFPILIWIRKLRKSLLITGLVFHLCIYIFLMIYGFQIIFVLIYGLFIPDKILTDLFKKINPGFYLKKAES